MKYIFKILKKKQFLLCDIFIRRKPSQMFRLWFAIFQSRFEVGKSVKKTTGWINYTHNKSKSVMIPYDIFERRKKKKLLWPPSCGNESFMAEHWARSFRNHCASRNYDIQRLRDVEPQCIVSVSNYTRRQFAFAGVEPVMILSHTSSP